MRRYQSWGTRSTEIDLGFSRRSQARRGAVLKLLALFVASVVAVSGLALAILMIRPDATSGTESRSIRIYCAASVVEPVEQVATHFNQQFDQQIEIVRTGGSGELAGQIKTEIATGMDGGADLFVTADELLFDQPDMNKIIVKSYPLAIQRPVIAVRAESQLRLSGIRELAGRTDLKVGVASERAAVGQLTWNVARHMRVQEELEANRTGEFENVMTLAQALVTGSLDAAIIWDTTVEQINHKETSPVLRIAARLDPNDNMRSSIAIGVVASASKRTDSLEFCRFLAESEVAKHVFAGAGFGIAPDHTRESNTN